MDTMTILVIDDEQGMRSAIARALRDFTVRLPDVNGEVRFRIIDAATGEEGFDLIEREDPPLVLLDYKLPGISGLDILERIDTDESRRMVIMMTAYASLETAVTATKRGAYDFLAKPFTPEELKNVIRKAAGRLILANQARQLAEEKRRVRFQFISVLAHELKAPIAAVEGYLQILENHTLGDDITGYDQVVKRSRVRLSGMRKLIGDLLDMTRIESGEKRRELADINVVEIARKSIETVQPDADDRRISLRLDAPVTLPLRADPGELEIIFNNLISNAVKYNREGGDVDIALGLDGDAVTIRVSDTGIGMTPEEAAMLFNDFVRIKNEKTRTILGSGLGLSTVKKLATLYNGSVSVESTPDVGSTFTVVLGRTTSA